MRKKSITTLRMFTRKDTVCAPENSPRARCLRAAFTLVELLVVIGVIAVLIAILLPALSRARAHAVKLQCLSQLRQQGTWITMYEQAYRGAMIPVYVFDVQFDNTLRSFTWVQFLWRIADYQRTDSQFQMLQCPARLPDPTWNVNGGTLHYGMNLYITPWDTVNNRLVWPKITKVHRTSELFYIADVPSNHAMLPRDVLPAWQPYYLHVKTANALFLDGHCESMGPQQFHYPPATADTENAPPWWPTGATAYIGS
jgi:prepilin-type N-terminal cleavage/methylation domain-containing protein/prepilin-type processing-associated H-X9-DG protein